MITVNNKPVSVFQFPGGERSVKVPIESTYGEQRYANITAIIKNSNDIMDLLLTADACKSMGFELSQLYIPYLPYARQDRVCNEGEALSIKVMADIINSMGFHKVAADDPHSDVGPALINNYYGPTWLKYVSLGLDSVLNKYDCLVSPDAGAEKKVLRLAQMTNKPMKTAYKIRDVATGEIHQTKFHDCLAGEDVIIIDDICDGGRTFIELAKVLKEKGANSVGLYVTHGIFSKGLTVLKEHIDSISCYHTFLDSYDSENLTVLNRGYK